MRITAVDTAIVSLPLPHPVVTPIHHITTIDNVLVTMTVDDGLQGVAYLWTFGARRAGVLRAMVDDLARLVIGEDPRATATLWSKLWRENNFLGRTGVAMLAHSALDIACWDLKGKAMDAPVWQLLGGTRQPLPVYAGGLFLSDSIEAIAAEARGYVTAGFRAMKMRTGSPTVAEDIARVEAVRHAIGPDVALMVDVVQGWTVERAIRLGRELARFDLTWIEDPLSFDDHAGMAAVAAAIDIPLCAGENDYSKLGFERLMEGRCIDIAMPDLQRVGGITEWMKVAAMAEARAMRVTPHVFHEISVHLMSAVPNGFWLEYVPWWDVLFQRPPALADGHLTASERPGLGLDFDWDGIDRHRMQ